MRFKNFILSRLFGSKPEESEKEEQVVSEEEEVVSPVFVDPTRLELPSEHALNRLWRLWREQTGQVGGAEEPTLCLAGDLKQPELLAEGKLERELKHLQQMVNSTAEARFSKAVPRWETPADTKGDGTKATNGEKSDEAEVAKIKVIPQLDAQVEVFLTRDQMSAWLLIYPPAGGGKELDQDMLVQALGKSGVSFGVNEELRDGLPESGERYFHLHLLAEGTLPVHGVDGYTVDLFPRIERRQMITGEDGQINYAEINIVHNIGKGDLICEIFESVSGTPGSTVLGKVLPAKEGKKVVIPKGRNTEVSEDGTALKASKEGRVEFNGRNFEVKTILEINQNVDYSTGNINFLGDIHIHGDVCGGFSIKAMGNVTVDGVVEDCTIEAGGDLIVAKGIKGDHQALIRSCRNIYAKYLENSDVCAKENLQSDCIINCNVYCDGTVNASSGRGIIIGGKIRAGKEVQANVVGSRAECITTVSLGGRPSDDFEYENLRREIDKLAEEFDRLQRQPDSPEKLRTLPMVRMKLSVDRTRLAQFEEFKKKDEGEEEHVLRRLVCKTAYPGTEIIIDDAKLHLKQEVEPCTAALSKGEVHLFNI